MIIEKREYARIPMSDEVCEINFRGKDYAGNVEELSIAGFGISGLEVEELKYGEPIRITYCGDVTHAICCSAKKTPDGKLHIGVRNNRDAFDSQERLVSRFVNLGGCEVACSIVHDDGQTARVQFNNGKFFEVNSSRLQSVTVDERSKRLANPIQLKMMAKFYDIKAVRRNNVDPEELIEAVLNVEFIRG